MQRFPGNDIILNNLLYTLDYRTRADEVISLCKTLIESSKDDSVKYDACRILATCYKENGQSDLIDMLIIVGKHLKENGETEKAISQFKIAQKVMDAFSDDFIEDKWFTETIYEYTSK